MKCRECRILAGFCLFVVSCVCAAGTDYDPLEAPEVREPGTVDLTVPDVRRDREIPLRVYLPAEATDAPVVLFSHGLGGSREGCSYLGEHWSARGYMGVFLQHPGSDTSVWKDKPRGRRLEAMRQAANARNFMLRVSDVKVVLDRLERWNGEEEHVLGGRLDLDRVGISGHSFGARTTQAVGGQKFAAF